MKISTEWMPLVGTQVVETKRPNRIPHLGAPSILRALIIAVPAFLVAVFVHWIWLKLATLISIPVLEGLGIPIAIGAGLGTVGELWKAGGAKGVGAALAKHSGLPIHQRISLLFSEHDMTRVEESEVAPILFEYGATGIVVLSGKSGDLGKGPVRVPFGPTPLDESAEAFRELEAAALSSLGPEDSSPGLEARQHGARPVFRRLVLGAGGLTILYLSLNVILSGIESLFRFKLSVDLAFWLSAWVFVLVGVRGFGAWRSNDQWLLVPGAVVRRVGAGRQWELYMFKRDTSLLIIREASRKVMRVSVSDGIESAIAKMTVAEAQLLLRAWLSPLPPPSVDQISDLA